MRAEVVVRRLREPMVDERGGFMDGYPVMGGAFYGSWLQ